MNDSYDTSDPTAGVHAMTILNLGLRFALELAGVAALAYWGMHASSVPVLQAALGLGAPLALIAGWALVVAPKATNGLAPDHRIVIGSALLIVAAAALGLAGRPELAAALALLVVANTAALVINGGTATALATMAGRGR
jgi:Protein of unknown function (DUF2568)